MHLKMSSAEVFCCQKLSNITDKLSIEANRVDPEQIASDLCPHCLPYRLFKHFIRREKQTTFVAIGVLRVNHVICLILSMCYDGQMNHLNMTVLLSTRKKS